MRRREVLPSVNLNLRAGWDKLMEMDAGMKQLQQTLIESETDAEQLLLARNQLIENDKLRNGNRESLTALRKIARTTKSSVPSSFDKILEELAGANSRRLVQEICPTCGDHDPKEHTWMMLPGSDIFTRMPFHAVHTVLEKDQERLDYESKTLQSFVKEKSFILSERGALAGSVNPGILKSLVTLKDGRK